jgi:hypothetical protein
MSLASALADDSSCPGTRLPYWVCSITHKAQY